LLSSSFPKILDFFHPTGFHSIASSSLALHDTSFVLAELILLVLIFALLEGVTNFLAIGLVA